MQPGSQHLETQNETIHVCPLHGKYSINAVHDSPLHGEHSVNNTHECPLHGKHSVSGAHQQTDNIAHECPLHGKYSVSNTNVHDVHNHEQTKTDVIKKENAPTFHQANADPANQVAKTSNNEHIKLNPLITSIARTDVDTNVNGHLALQCMIADLFDIKIAPEIQKLSSNIVSSESALNAIRSVVVNMKNMHETDKASQKILKECMEATIPEKQIDNAISMLYYYHEFMMCIQQNLILKFDMASQ